MDIGSKNRLTPRASGLFTSPTLFDEIARSVCRAGVLPRKELYESWQFAKRVTRHARGARLVDLCAGHGLIAPMLLLLDKTIERAVSVERSPPPSARKIRTVLCERWPALEPRWVQMRGDLDDVTLAATDLVTAVHACGALTDRVLDNAMTARAAVAVMPCCHEIASVAFLNDWLEPALALDTLRAARLQQAGYRVSAHQIDPLITPQNRVLVGVLP